MKKLNIFLLTLTLILFNLLVYNNVYAKGKLPSVSADGAVLIDATTGKVLYSKNANIQYPPASTTKIMTALLTLENCNLNDMVTIGKNPPKTDGSTIYLLENEQISVKNLLYALLINSANDSAVALAEHISGSVGEFANLMNKRALELGCTHTHFVNPNGLYDNNHRTSAMDLALIMRELVKHPEFSQISKTLAYRIPATNKCKDIRNLWNKNKLIQKNSKSYYPACEGAKTGYTIQSFHSYVASANKDGQRLIVALIHDKKKTFFQDAINLFNYGYNNFELVKLYSAGDIASTYKDNKNNITFNLLSPSDFYYVKEKDSTSSPSFILENKDLSSMSFRKGDAVLNMNISLNDSNIGSLKLLSDCDHLPNSFKNSKIKYFGIFIFIFMIILFLIINIKRKLRANN